MLSRSPGVLIAAILVASCTRSQPSTTSADAGRAAPDPYVYGAGVCNWLARCEPAFVRGSFGDVPACASAFTDEATKLFAAQGTQISKRQLDACIARTESASCSDEIEALADCDFKGTLPDGAPCASGVQCASGSCLKPAGERCGVCAARAAIGASCATAACPPGSTCEAERCVQPAALSAPCDSSSCRSDLVCVDGRCSAPLGRGAGCSGAVPCDARQGLSCMTGACSALAVEVDHSCAAVPYCVRSRCDAAARQCVPLLPAGAACSGASDCQFPLDCTQGTCTRHEPSTCK